MKNNKNLDITKLIEQFNIEDINDLDKLFGQIKKEFIESALEAEFDEHIGYEKYDQNSRQVSNNYRKGKTNKTISTTNGKITIKIPRDEDATFEPKIIKKYQRNISKIEDQIIFLYSKGMSTRDIQDTIYEMFSCDLDKNTISRITDRIVPEIRAWQNRPLEKTYTVVYVDGIRFKVLEDSSYVEKSVYIIIGINIEGKKEILGFWISESESAKQWFIILNELKARGVEEILIACSDNLKGISESFKSAFPNVRIQKCIIHQIRNSVKFVNYKDLKDFNSDMKKIYKADNIKKATEALDEFEKKWESKYSYATRSWRNNFDELSTFFELPIEIRKIIYTTNTIENLNRNIRKITKTKGGFTTVRSLEKLIYLRLMRIQEDWGEHRIPNWITILNQLRILFPEQLCDIN